MRKANAARIPNRPVPAIAAPAVLREKSCLPPAGWTLRWEGFLLPAQSGFACLKFHAFCKMHRRQSLFSFG